LSVIFVLEGVAFGGRVADIVIVPTLMQPFEANLCE
jgi:hypothetical protein